MGDMYCLEHTPNSVTNKPKLVGVAASGEVNPNGEGGDLRRGKRGDTYVEEI